MTYMDKLAAQHALTLHDPEASGEAIHSALDWIEYGGDHLTAFNRVERFMRACDGISQQELARLKLSPMQSIPAVSGFGWKFAALAASILLLVIVGVSFLSMQTSGTFQEARYETQPDTIRSIRLGDGSNITLAGASAVSVSFHANRRSVNLLSGEALFSVAPDANRPFTVQTKNGSTTAIGTAFNIHRGANDTTVTVLHGKVEVLAQGAGYTSRATLDRSMEVRYSSAGEMGVIKHVDPGMIASWRRGEFHFADTPLASVIDDLNRYSTRPIVIEDPSLRQMKISGIVVANGILEWLGSLPAVADVQIIETPRDIRIRARREQKTLNI